MSDSARITNDTKAKLAARRSFVTRAGTRERKRMRGLILSVALGRGSDYVIAEWDDAMERFR